MKLLFIILIVPYISIAQDCKVLDSLNSFHGVKFGDNIKLTKLKNAEPLEDHFYQIDKLITFKYKELQSFLNFGSFSFEQLFVVCNEKNEIFNFTLKEPISYSDSIYLDQSKEPYSIRQIRDKLISIFGNYTIEKSLYDPEMKFMGNGTQYSWICNNIKLELSFRHSGLSFANGTALNFTNIELEKKYEISKIIK